MTMRLDKFNFSFYKCKTLKEVVKSIDVQWDAKLYSITDGEVKYIVKNIINKNLLRSKDSVKIFNNISSVNTILKESFHLELPSFLKKVADLIQMDDDLKNHEIFDILYDNFLVFYNIKGIDEAIFYFAKKLEEIGFKEQNFTYKGRLLSDIEKSKKGIITYFRDDFIQYIDVYCSDFSIFEKKFYIGQNTDLFYKIAALAIVNDIKNIVLNCSPDSNRIIFNVFKDIFRDIDNKILIFKQIIDSYLSDGFFNENTDLWFNEMLNNFGYKYEGYWTEFSQQQYLSFRKWYVLARIDEFFSREIGDPQRAEFWKRYANYITDIYYMKRYAQAIVMVFPTLVVVEFGKVGNATYVYNINDVNLREIESYRYVDYPVSSTVYKLKNKYKAIGLSNYSNSPGWNHSGNWQQKFYERLLYFGYDMER